MNETLREFAELVGRCLAKRWLRERDLRNNTTAAMDAHVQGGTVDDHEHASRPRCPETHVSQRTAED